MQFGKKNEKTKCLDCPAFCAQERQSVQSAGSGAAATRIRLICFSQSSFGSGKGVHHQNVGVQHDVVSAFRQNLTDFLRIVDPLHIQVRWISLGILSDQLDGFGLRLSLDDYTFLFILGLFHQVLRSFSLLLRDLLGLNGVLEFLAERQIADGNIIDNDIELLSPLRKKLSDFI